ncbi:YlbL family protein [Frondihabitans australicus]|uniref:endopeptidase La n=1 Tax=Frondihabitans australicus TaxID=386892 RepID=A0A495IG07_9MICO|nr:PDZ domain-containing protein [Frondihabitans australicus]RKR74874.1 PDZ domain-containing protein [Frondihabitans australicus]
MAYFAAPETPTIAPPRRRRGVLGLAFLGAALVIAVVLSLLPAPYLIEQPGPVFNTLGTNPYDGKQTPLITVSGHKTYATSGSLDLLTVSVVGNQTQRPNWAELVRAYFDPSRAVIPVEEIFPSGVSNKQVDQQNTIDMQQSQKSAVTAALAEEGYAVGTAITVSDVEKGSPASGKLAKGDVITAINGHSLTSNSDVDTLRALIAKNGAKPATIAFRSGDSTGVKTTSITPQDEQGTYLLGIGATVTYDFPFSVTLKLADVGGPSAGMMFALGIIDKITPGKLNGGASVAGTGTIDAGGTVGAIGGIRQKMYGAREAGATVFLAPKSNCNEVTGHIPSGLHVYATTSLSQSVTILKTLSGKGSTSSLPTCPAS